MPRCERQAVVGKIYVYNLMNELKYLLCVSKYLNNVVFGFLPIARCTLAVYLYRRCVYKLIWENTIPGMAFSNILNTLLGVEVGRRLIPSQRLFNYCIQRFYLQRLAASFKYSC